MTRFENRKHPYQQQRWIDLKTENILINSKDGSTKDFKNKWNKCCYRYCTKSSTIFSPRRCICPL